MTQSILCIEKRSDRVPVRNLLRRLGVRIVHDSGGRLMVIVAPDDSSSLRERLPYSAEVLPVGKIPAAILRDCDEHDTLFAKALKRRQSKDYREAKEARIPGSSPEEQEIFSGICELED